jgi:vacuolar protein sorting-associated protein 54
MLRDIDHFETRLGNLDGFEDAGEYLRNIAKSKEVARPEPPAAAPAADEPEEKKTSEAEEQTEAEKQPEPAKESNGDTEAKPSEEVAAQAG